MRFLTLAMMAVASGAAAQTTVILPSVPDGAYYLQVTNSVATITMGTVVRIGPAPKPEPKPEPKPIPTTDLRASATAALANVADENKGQHAKQLAFTIQFILSNIGTTNAPAGDALAAMSQIPNRVLGADEAKWSKFFLACDPYLQKCTTAKQVAEAYKVIQSVIESAIPPQAAGEEEDFSGVDTYGLMQEMGAGGWLAFIIKIWPLIMMILESFRS